MKSPYDIGYRDLIKEMEYQIWTQRKILFNAETQRLPTVDRIKRRIAIYSRTLLLLKEGIKQRQKTLFEINENLR